VPSTLPPDSLAWSLLLAARAVAAVRDGKSLTEGLLVSAGEAPATRAAAADVAYGVLRRYGWGDFILGRLLEKALPHPEVHALLLAALYRLETRPEATHTVVDQAVAAAGEIARLPAALSAGWSTACCATSCASANRCSRRPPATTRRRCSIRAGG